MKTFVKRNVSKFCPFCSAPRADIGQYSGIRIRIFTHAKVKNHERWGWRFSSYSRPVLQGKKSDILKLQSEPLIPVSAWILGMEFFVEDLFHFLIWYRTIRIWQRKPWLQKYIMYPCIKHFSSIALATILQIRWKLTHVRQKLNARKVESEGLPNITKSWRPPRPKSSIVKIFLKVDFSSLGRCLLFYQP